MDIINEQKVIDKLRELIGKRCLDLNVDFGEHNVIVTFGLSDIYIPKDNPPYLSLKDLNNISDEFGDKEINFRVGAYRMIIGFLIKNKEYYI